ncbi:MAG: InlB B-repeat-containing protein, partial [Oscillospiraceae bacterium]|nr:InlB B-repeat-containing protein [Oscillospiraceae bacterium]
MLPTTALAAEEAKWEIEVIGKSDTELFVGERTFTVRDYNKGAYEGEEYNSKWSATLKDETREWTVSNLGVMAKDDIAVFTKGGETFDGFHMTAWSDTDGDGVYDNRFMGVEQASTDFVVPPSSDSDSDSPFYFYSYAYFMPPREPNEFVGYPGWDSEYGSFGWLIGDGGGAAEVTELKLPAEYLLEEYGSNTLISFFAYNDDGKREVICTVVLTDELVPDVETYTVTFDSDDGSAVAAQTVAEGGKVTEPAAPTKAKHAFDGWYDEDGNKWDFGAAVTGDITLYAKWVEKDYTVSFNSNGGSSVAAQYVDGGDYLAEPAVPTKDGNTFGGWYRDTVFEKVEDTVYTLEVDTENLFNDVYKWNFDTDVVMGD